MFERTNYSSEQALCSKETALGLTDSRPSKPSFTTSACDFNFSCTDEASVFVLAQKIHMRGVVGSSRWNLRWCVRCVACSVFSRELQRGEGNSTWCDHTATNDDHAHIRITQSKITLNMAKGQVPPASQLCAHPTHKHGAVSRAPTEVDQTQDTPCQCTIKASASEGFCLARRHRR